MGQTYISSLNLILDSLDSKTTGGSDVLNIGNTNADIINIGRSGATVNIFGAVSNYETTNANITDALITLNKGGGAGTGFGVGFEIEENALITGYLKTNAARDGYLLKAPANIYYADFNFASLSANRTYTMPNNSGTFALLSDITGGVGVSGTANYVSKFTAGTTLGNSLIQDNGTSLSAGVAPNANTFLNLSNTYSATTGAVSYGVRNVTNFNINENFFKYGFRQETSHSEANTAGIVGINSYMSYGDIANAPFANFLATGVKDGDFGDSSCPNWYMFKADNITSAYTSITNLYGFYVSNLTTATNNWAVYTAGTTKSYFGGAVGINKTSAAAQLEIVGTGTGTGTYGLKVHASGGTSNSLVVVDNGRVGIGTDAPVYNMDLKGSNPFFAFNSTSNGFFGLTFSHTSGTAPATIQYGGGDLFALPYATGNSAFRISRTLDSTPLAGCSFHFNPSLKFLRLLVAEASSGTTLINSPYINFESKYWNGSVSTATTFNITNIADNTSGLARLSFDKLVNYAGTTNLFNVLSNGNIGLGTSTFGTSSAGVLAIKNGTATTASLADQIHIFSKDSSDGITNATLGMYLEQTVEAGVAVSSTNKLKVWINNTEYYLLLTAV